MKSNLRVLYGTTLAKYSKFKSRYDKNVRNGHFYNLSDRKKSQIISKLKRLYNRLCQLQLQLKLAAATGILSLTLSTSQAQQLGPFVQNDTKNPFVNANQLPENRNEQVALTDLDNDGDLDVVIGSGYGTLQFLENVGTASNPIFENRTSTDNPFNGIDVGNYASPAFADIDNDGDLDLVLGNETQSLAFFENTGDVNNPNFNTVENADPTPVDDITNFKYYKRVTFVDIDGDGDLDIFAGENNAINAYSANYAIVSFWENTGTQFTQRTGTANPLFNVLGNDAASLSYDISKAFPDFVDIDDDGDEDLFIGDANGNLRFFRNEGSFDSPSFPAEVTGVSNPLDGINTTTNASPEFVDLDNDGDYDLIFSTGTRERLRFLENIGSSSNPIFEEKFRSENPLSGIAIGDYDIAPSTVDLDGDGFLDIVIGSKYEQTLFYFENNRNGTFTEKVGLDNPFENLAGLTIYEENPVPAFADIDGDLDLDLFVSVKDTETGPYIPEVKFWSNDGSNNFTPATSPITTYAYSSKFSATVNDFDGDGDIDAIIGTPSFGSSFIFSRNDGGATWQDQPSGNAPFFGVDIAAGITEYAKPIMVDLDHDGDFDVVAGVDNSTLAGQLVFFRNTNGVLLRQNFAANPFDGIDVGNESHPAFIDIDNDGDLDVLIGEAYGGITFVENQNEAPTLSLATGPINYTEGDGPVIIDPTLDITDDALGEGDLIKEARVQILNYVSGEDVLTFTPSSNPDANITGSFVTTGLDAGTLILTGVDTIKNFLPVLQSVRYQNTSISPSTTTRNVQFSVTDWDNTNPSPANININITAINSSPTVTASANPNAVYTEDDTPGVIIDGGLIVSDPDNTTLASATVQITTGFLGTEDILEFTDQNGITGSYNSATGLLTLTGSASVANYQTAIRSVRYSNTSQDPNNSNRTIRIRVNDGTINSNLATRVVEVVPVNDPPVVSSSNTAALDYDQNTTAIIVDDLIDIIDVDDSQLLSATVTISGYQTGDILAGTAPTGGSVDFDATSGILTLSGTATIAEYVSALSAVTFESDQAGSRQLSFIVNDGTDDSNVYSRDLNIIVPNVPPVISSTNAGSAVDYVQNGSALILDNQIAISDVDDTDLESLTITIGNYVTGDTLIIAEAPGTVVAFDEVAGTLVLSGTNSVAEYQSALQSLSFASSNAAGSRQILIVANDGQENSNTFTIDVNINDEIIPQPPVVNTTPSTTQEGSRLTIDLCAIISDPDNTFDELIIAVVSITSGAITTIDGCDLIIDYEGLDFSGIDSIVLSATDPDGNTDQNTLTITVEEQPLVNGGNLLIYNAISPNGDGANDWWEIVNLTTPNKIELYNRWGDLVKTLNDYENIENNSQLDDLPVGTYFYKISSPQGEYTGYITIKK